MKEKNKKKTKSNDPKRVVVKENDRNDNKLILDTSISIPIADNRIIQTYFIEIVDLFVNAAAKNKELKDAIESVTFSKDYINGPVKKFNAICKSHNGDNPFTNLFKNMFE